jgi:polar amino acid transport system substrate-binding protein
VLLVLALTVAACQFPRDVDGTLSKVRGGEIRAGIVPNEPWVTLEGAQPGGVEVRLLEEFAREQDAAIRWVRGAESELIEALEGGQLDVVIGGLTRDSTHQQHVTLTRPYATTEAVFAAPRGVEIPDDLDGVRVGVEAHSPEAAELERQTDAEPVPLETIEGFDGPVVIEDHEADDLGLVRTDRSLAEEEHVFAITHGENAFLTALERFLLDRGEEAMRMLHQEDAP